MLCRNLRGHRGRSFRTYLGHVKFILRVEEALSSHGQQFSSQERVPFSSTLLELLPGIQFQERAPWFPLLVAPVEPFARPQDLSVEMQSLSRMDAAGHS